MESEERLATQEHGVSQKEGPMKPHGNDGQGRDSIVPEEMERTYTDEERRMFEERLNVMNRAEYAAFIRDLVVDKVREALFLPLINTLKEEQKRLDIALTALKYEDFWEYRELMAGIDEKCRGLDAELVYHMAKKESLEKGN